MSITLNQAIIHSFTKAAQTNNVTDIVKKQTLLDTTRPAVFALVEGVAKLIGKQGNAVTYGQFQNNNREGRFPKAFHDYSLKTSDESIFLKLSHIAVDELADSAREQLLATGGHILIANYLNDSVHYVLIAMIKQRGGVSLDENYVPIEITEIDLSKVYQAARINISRYSAVNATTSSSNTDEDRTYLCFLGQSKDNPASGYFVLALGCTKGIASSRATTGVIEAIQEFFSQPNLKDFRNAARNAVHSYLHSKVAKNEDAILNEIIHEVSRCVPAEHREKIEGLHEFMNDEKRKIPNQFRVDSGTLKKKTRIKSENQQWSIQFEHLLLGETPDAKIHYNRERKSISINSIDDVNLISEIEAELDSRT